MATIRNKEISKTGGVCLSFVAVLGNSGSNFIYQWKTG